MITSHTYPLEFLDIELTERCNLNCVHCYINRPATDQDALTRESSLRLLRRILKEARRIGCTDIRFTGGEPLLHKNFPKIYRFAVRNGFHVWISTNATMVTEEIASLFLMYPPTGVSVSIYGWDDHSYEKTTATKNSFIGFLNGVHRLRRSGIRFEMKMPAVPWLLENRASVEKLARGLGASNDLPFVWELSLRARHDPRKSKRIQSLRMSPAKAAETILDDEIRRVRDPQAVSNFQRPCAPNKRLFNCRAGKRRLTINAYGELQVCLEMRHPSTTYDLRTGTLRDALSSFIPAVRAMVSNNYEYIQRCGQCLLRRICAQCPACSWMEHSTLDTPVEYYCEVAHQEAKKLGFLVDDEKGWSVHHLRQRISVGKKAEPGAV